MNCWKKSLFALCMFMVLFAPTAMAKTVKHFAVTPFVVNGPDKYQYLSDGIQDMLGSRLHWTGSYEAVGKDKVRAALGGEPVTDGNAQAMLTKLGVDYIIFGSLTILGNSCSVDIRVMDASGKATPKTAQVELDRVIPVLENMASSINAEVFGREDSGGMSADSGDQPRRVNAMNPMLVHNEPTADQEFYLNPQFRYAGDESASGRLRSPTLPYVGSSMVVADIDGDGLNEAVIASGDKLHAYRFNAQNQMEPLGEHALGSNLEVLRLSILDMNRDGLPEIVVSAVSNPVGAGDDERNINTMLANTPSTYIMSFSNGRFERQGEPVRLFMSTAIVPPNFSPILVGQQKGSKELFSQSVHEVVKMGGEYTLGGGLLLPPEGNVYNFTYLQQEGADYRIVLTNRKDKLNVYSRAGEPLYTTDKVFSGSSLGLVSPYTSVGMRDKLMMKDPYYVPLRLVPFDLNKDGTAELLANHPVSVAAQFFTRYRYFPQGEIHCMSWDGVGLSLNWKTRRIKGSVVDYGVADINNDGISDLYVLINTHPGIVGAKFRRTTVLFYPLDIGRMDSVIDSEFTEE
jgi:TolB-like protein